jgi:phage tail protein X
MVRDSSPPGAASAPLPLLEPAQHAAFPQTVSVVVRTMQKGDQLAKVAREVYGVSNQAILAWIKHNNPHLQNVNRINVGIQLTFPPLPVSSPRQGQGTRHDQ